MNLGATPFRVVLVEDSPDDALLVRRALRAGGLAAEIRVVDTEEGLSAALAEFVPDILLADLQLPNFSGTEAIAVVRAWNPEVPCILLSGTVGERLVVEALRSRATDYVPKHHLEALVPAVRRALEEASERRERGRLDAELRRSEARYHLLLESTPDAMAIHDGQGNVSYANRAMRELMGLQKGAALPSIWTVIPPAALAEVAGRQASRQNGDRAATRYTMRLVTPGGDEIPADITSVPLGPDGPDSRFLLNVRDVSELQRARAHLEVESRVRLALANGLHAVPDTATAAEAAQSLCDELAQLPFVDVAGIDVILESGEVRVLAISGAGTRRGIERELISPARAALLRVRSANGPWAEYVTTDPREGFSPAVAASGLKAIAYGPIFVGTEPVGLVVIGTYHADVARTLVEDLPGLAAMSTTSGALLSARLLEIRRNAAAERELEQILVTAAFRPVFQPVVDLLENRVVGYEALTRFASGRPPADAFADAWAVGLGAALEVATITASIEAARELPPGWLSINVSPGLATRDGALRDVLARADRPIVVELTEHATIDDYAAVRNGLRSLEPAVRVAVDDAGAGIANFGHILELAPDLVKLDISLVREVDGDLRRQALIVGMRHFASEAGCELVAEGIETEAEAVALREFGVEYGQGYLFARAAPARHWAALASLDERKAIRLRPPQAPGAPAPVRPADPIRAIRPAAAPPPSDGHAVEPATTPVVASAGRRRRGRIEA